MSPGCCLRFPARGQQDLSLDCGHAADCESTCTGNKAYFLNAESLRSVTVNGYSVTLGRPWHYRSRPGGHKRYNFGMGRSAQRSCVLVGTTLLRYLGGGLANRRDRLFYGKR